jgi:1,4-alpha-glucan branching enzyme/maltooligosyltrehalose trehalohydrolase
VRWRLGDGATLTMLANPGDNPGKAPMAARGRVLYESTPGIAAEGTPATLPAWSVAVSLADAA